MVFVVTLRGDQLAHTVMWEQSFCSGQPNPPAQPERLTVLSAMYNEDVCIRALMSILVSLQLLDSFIPRRVIQYFVSCCPLLLMCAFKIPSPPTFLIFDPRHLAITKHVVDVRKQPRLRNLFVFGVTLSTPPRPVDASLTSRDAPISTPVQALHFGLLLL